MMSLPSREARPQTSTASQTSAEASWSGLVERIRSGDVSAMEELYSVFSKGVRLLICRQLGPQDLDDKVHHLFLIITQAIRRGDLREPERLMGYVRTVVRRQVAAHIDSAADARRNWRNVDNHGSICDITPDPESAAIASENGKLALRILRSIPRRDRGVLIRFYLKEQRPEEICREMERTPTQFRLIKSRAKTRFGQLGKRRMELRLR